jgi:predicted metalloprotease
MKWEEGQESENVEDRRGFPIGGRGASIGCGGLVLLLLVSWLTGVSPSKLLDIIQSSSSDTPSASSTVPPAAPSHPGASAAPADKLGKFAAVVLASTERAWKEVFAGMGKPYQEPKLVLFSGATRSACGMASLATGPFYCQLDRKVYLDMSFFRELSDRFGAPGDFADAYVIAHEVGHHVQNELGIFAELDRSRADKATSVRIELQADCFAGVWGNRANRDHKLIEPGDFEEGLRAAGAIGDDRLQRMASGHVAPESFTHGTSQERAGWLRRGLETGDPGQCDTFRTVVR